MDNELQILSKTSHTNIMKIYELLHDENFYFIVSEYLRHGDLLEYIVKEGKITENKVRTIVK